MPRKMKPGGALPVTEKRSKAYGVRTEKKYREGRIKYVSEKWGGRWHNKQASPVVGAKGDTALSVGREMGVYKKRKK